MLIAIWLLVIGLIIAAFILMANAFPTNVLILDIVVACLAWTSLFWTWRLPWAIQINDRRQTARSLGEMGVGWWVSGWYAFLSIMFMIWGYFQPIPFKWQVLVQAALLVFLIAGMFSTVKAGEKVSAVEDEQREQRRPVVDTRERWNDLVAQTELISGLPAEVKERIERLASDCRYISPSPTPRARDLDAKLYSLAGDISRALPAYDLNDRQISQWLQEAQVTLKQRKSVY